MPVIAGEHELLESRRTDCLPCHRPRPHLDVVRRADLVDQILRHAAGQRFAADEHDDVLGVSGEVHRCLACRIGTTNNVDVLPLHRFAFGHGGPVIDAGSGELVDSFGLEPAVGNPCGDEQCAAAQLAAIAQLHAAGRSFCSELHHFLCRQDLDTEPSCLAYGPACQLPAGQASRKAEIVLDARAHSRLPSGSMPFDNQGTQTFRSAIDRRSQPRRTGANNDEIIEGLIRAGLQPHPLGDLAVLRLLENGAVREEKRRQFQLLLARDFDELSRLFVYLGIEPQVGDTVTCQEILHPV